MVEKARQSTMKKVVMTSTVATGLALATPMVAEAALGDQTLRFGMNHSDVIELQDVLSNKGFFTYEKSTGYFGTITIDAVKDFQRANNLTADGIVGPKTFAALGKAQSSNGQASNNNNSNNTTTTAPTQVASSGILRNGSRGSAVTTLQQQLASLGYYKIKVDGIYGNGTRQAVLNFQRDHNLLVDGIAGPQTLQALANKAGGQAPPQNSNSGSSSKPKEETATPAPPSNIANGIYRVGSSGNAVTELQAQLRSVGVFNQNPTGYFGKDTEASVRAFQRSHNLTVDGIAGPQTLAKLREVATNQGGQQQTGSGNSGNSGGSSTTSPAAFVTNLIAEASLHIGVPYLWGGTTTSGFDCSGYIQYVFKQQGVNLTRTVATQWNAGTAVSQPSVGDVVFFETYTSGPSHNGIYIGNNQFIHSGSSTGVTITSMDNPYWKARYLGAKRLH
ncbi:hypothetical protein AJ85_17985 [Alkalihalobacillus alcalophilus ATCC 27647 = CGMCC 1.3604]|uniref:NlpC/P60 domain-containing protein n=2 Tax=Alkalihalobacillus alcalophilus ATCC 27647 = CGMCC 1.3604 TaxID=1218173 RepID=A0A4S4JW54_ALKAL|nr:peptidoglycan-binding protein [Alkalihalobacillus alcalophilus]MED1563834.1 peptidoglycan-binding protein [Alkalihalobacillus alcalophilus]THG89384.1 hypothetical protein AJ85_17985 [Alkalihalobacillus alcalophilus ATCC 27647 = CGMCC 1.3604]